MKMFRSHLLLCGGTGCHASGSLNVKKALVAELLKRGLTDEIKLVETGCNGFCAMGPIMVVYPRASSTCRLNRMISPNWWKNTWSKEGFSSDYLP